MPKGYSPINGQPIPEGKQFVTGDSRAREAQRKGAESKKARRSLREELITLLEVETKVNGKMRSAQESMSVALLKQAIKGNTRAFEIIRDTIGEKPVENVNFVTPDYSALDDAFKQMSEQGESLDG